MKDIIGKLNTSIHTEGKNTLVTLYNTIIVEFNDEKIILRSDGFKTILTRSRMNQTSLQFSLGFMVYQFKKDWYIRHDGIVTPFTEGMIILR